MINTKHQTYIGWGYAKNLIREYGTYQKTPLKSRIKPRERKAISDAIEHTKRLKDGTERLKLIDLVFFKKTHKLRKRWVAVKGEGVRKAHGKADGQTVNIDEPFIVGGEKMMFPGDTSSASGWNLYNCRCGMRTVEKEGIEAEKRQVRVYNPETGKNELVEDMTYEEWAKLRGVTPKKPKVKTVVDKKQNVPKPKKEKTTKIKEVEKPQKIKSVDDMSRKELVSEAKKIYIENGGHANLTKEQAEKRFNQLIAGNSTTDLRKYVRKNRKKR